MERIRAIFDVVHNFFQPDVNHAQFPLLIKEGSPSFKSSQSAIKSRAVASRSSRAAVVISDSFKNSEWFAPGTGYRYVCTTFVGWNHSSRIPPSRVGSWHCQQNGGRDDFQEPRDLRFLHHYRTRYTSTSSLNLLHQPHSRGPKLAGHGEESCYVFC